jgi:ligand-binding sensor protein/two-component sensor histidine kinase
MRLFCIIGYLGGRLMQTVNSFVLGEIVNTQILQEIQDKFSEVTGFGAVIVDREGNPVTHPSNFTEFCSYIRSFPPGLFRCVNSDDWGGRQRKKPLVYLCHSGLTDLAAPIIVQNEYIGAFLAGQVVLEQKDYDAKAEMLRRTANLNLDERLLADFFDIVPVVPEQRIKAAADLIYIMSNYIVEIGVANIVGKQLVDELQAKANLESLLRATELKALQSQINPHFLFNTLNTIARLALLEGASQTQEVVYALSDLLRNNLRDIEVLRTLDQELKSIRDYLTIQQVRFGERIQVAIEVDSQILNMKIPALTLQPLVENSIIHGLENKVEGGKIEITGTIHGNQMIICVSDTGIGIPEEIIRSIFQAEKRTQTHGQTTGLGIINVHKRIQHYFGSEYGLVLDSKLGAGTTISIRLPVCQA